MGSTKIYNFDERDERALVVSYLRRQAEGSAHRAEEMEDRGEAVMSASLHALARTIEGLASRIEAGAHLDKTYM